MNYIDGQSAKVWTKEEIAIDAVNVLGKQGSLSIKKNVVDFVVTGASGNTHYIGEDIIERIKEALARLNLNFNIKYKTRFDDLYEMDEVCKYNFTLKNNDELFDLDEAFQHNLNLNDKVFPWKKSNMKSDRY